MAREMAADWQQFPGEVKAVVTGWAATDTATTLRRVIRSAQIRAAVEAAGKIRCVDRPTSTW